MRWSSGTPEGYAVEGPPKRLVALAILDELGPMRVASGAHTGPQRSSMESATVRRAPLLPEATRLGLIGLLFGLAVIAWALTDDRMSGMDAGPGTDTGALGWFLGVWLVMMAAMMFPSIAPMVVMHARIQEGKRERGGAATGATPLFVAGYLVTWTAAGCSATPSSRRCRRST